MLVDPGIERIAVNYLSNDVKDWHESGWSPMKRMGTPADIGNAVTLLCTEEASFITGQTLYVDGGASVMFPEMPLHIQGF